MKRLTVLIIAILSILPMAAEQLASIETTGSWVYLYNPQGKRYKTLSASSMGQILGYSSSIIVTRSSSWIYIYDSDGKKIRTLSASSVGDVIGVAGDTFTSRSGSWIYTWNKEGKKISTRSAH